MDVEEPAAVTPLVRVVRGEPTPEELAALVAVLAARAGDAAASPRPAAPSAWASREASLRRALTPGPGAWQGAALVPGTRTRAAP